MSSLRLAFCSPLPPERSGVSEYSVQLLTALEPHFGEVRLFSSRAEDVSAEIRRRHVVASLDDLPRWADRDATLYQIGNEPRFHGAIYEMALREPGIVVLHEYMLQHLIRGITVDRRRSRDYIATMRTVYGEQGDLAARRFLRTGAARDLWAYPLFEPIVDASRGVIVHNETTRDRILRSRPDASVKVIAPPLYEDSVCQELSAEERSQIRHELGVPQDAFVVGSFGLMSEAKRLEVAVAAFQRFRQVHPEALYYLVGDASPYLGFESLLRGPQGEGVVATGRQEMPDFLRYMQTTDIAVNLRHPSGGETSATALRLLGMGKPVVVSDAGWLREIPNDAVVKVAVDDREAQSLLAALWTLAEEPELRLRLGANARSWALAQHAPDLAADRYIQAIQRLSSRQPRRSASWLDRAIAGPSPDVTERIVGEVGEALFDLGAEESEDEILGETAVALEDAGFAGA